MHVGLVMASGGARAAYQAGVLKRIGRLRAFADRPTPFRIIEGVSAGAINAAALAVGADDFSRCTRFLAELWSSLEPDRIFRTDAPTLLVNALRWGLDLTLGGLTGGGHAQSLLDASPLRALLARHHRTEAISANIARGHLEALAVAATDYASGRTFVFIQGSPGHAEWAKTRRVGLAAEITVDHLCASAAIPVVFAPVRLRTRYGISWFGDGCLRLPAPLGPAIRLGADRILAIGLRHRPTRDEPDELPLSTGPVRQSERPSLAQVLGVSLSALFMDQLDSDCEHLERINAMVEAFPPTRPTDHHPSMRPVRTFFITPSIDPGAIAEAHFHAMPARVRYLMGGLGVRNTRNADLISYLLFARAYTAALVDAGWRDADARIDEIEDLLRAPVPS